MARSATYRPAHKLPLRVRAMARLGARGTPEPEPICEVAVESGLEVPAPGGIALITDHYIPLLSGPRPTLLVRTPYGRGFPWDQLFGAQFARHGFHVVIQSCRGTGGSGGEFEPMRNEAADGRAAVAWLREQEWFNGALGTIGPSYLGYVQWALAADPPPELRAMVAQNSMSDVYSFLYRGGALALEDALTGGAAHAVHGARIRAAPPGDAAAAAACPPGQPVAAGDRRLPGGIRPPGRAGSSSGWPILTRRTRTGTAGRPDWATALSRSAWSPAGMTSAWTRPWRCTDGSARPGGRCGCSSGRGRTRRPSTTAGRSSSLTRSAGCGRTCPTSPPAFLTTPCACRSAGARSGATCPTGRRRPPTPRPGTPARTGR